MRMGIGLGPRTLPAVLVALPLAVTALAGCSGGTSNSAASAPGVRQAPAPNPAARAAAPNSAARAAAPGSTATGSGTGSQARLAASSDIVYTATLTVRAANVSTADAQAKDIVTGMGGYVSGETTAIDPSHPAWSTATLELKVPVASYATALSRLGAGLGTETSLHQQAQDVTQDVADVSSRVASDQASIAQLRGLLDRASSVGDVLNIQGQISQQESDLESLEARQRALSHEVSYATVSLQLVTVPPPARQHRRSHGSGFVQGLSGGWHALRLVGSGLFTGFGAVLPFAVLIAAAGYLGYRGRRMWARRRARAAG